MTEKDIPAEASQLVCTFPDSSVVTPLLFQIGYLLIGLRRVSRDQAEGLILATSVMLSGKSLTTQEFVAGVDQLINNQSLDVSREAIRILIDQILGKFQQFNMTPDYGQAVSKALKGKFNQEP